MKPTILAATTLFAASSAAAAEIVTERFDIATLGLGIFGVQYSADFLSDAHPGVIREVRFIGSFTTDHAFGSFHDAAAIGIDFQLPTTGVPFWSFNGADLGWSGTGAFDGSLSTSAFDGQPLLDVPSDASLLYFFRVFSTDNRKQALGGSLAGSYFEVDVEIVPTPAATVALLISGAMLTRRRVPRS